MSELIVKEVSRQTPEILAAANYIINSEGCREYMIKNYRLKPEVVDLGFMIEEDDKLLVIYNSNTPVALCVFEGKIKKTYQFHFCTVSSVRGCKISSLAINLGVDFFVDKYKPSCLFGMIVDYNYRAINFAKKALKAKTCAVLGDIILLRRDF